MTEDVKTQSIKEVASAKRNLEDRRVDGRVITRKLVGNDKLLNPQGAIANGSITQAQLANNSVGQAQFKSETATLAFGSGDTSKTATVTSGDIIIGVYSSSVTSTPAYGELQLSISGTTLTGTRSASPGGAAAITYTVTLLKA